MDVEGSFPADLAGPFLTGMGARFLHASGDRVVLELPVSDALKQPYGIVHGGVYCALAESAANVAGALWLTDGRVTVGISNHTHFLHAVRAGTLTAEATPVHRGRLLQLWTVSITAEREVARSEVRLANIERG